MTHAIPVMKEKHVSALHSKAIHVSASALQSERTRLSRFLFALFLLVEGSVLYTTSSTQTARVGCNSASLERVQKGKDCTQIQ